MIPLRPGGFVGFRKILHRIPSAGIRRRKIDTAAAGCHEPSLGRQRSLAECACSGFALAKGIQIGFVSEIIEPGDLHDIGATRFALGAQLRPRIKPSASVIRRLTSS